MATNLVSQIVEALGPTIVSRIASSLGLDQSATQKTVGAAVPGLLAAFISLVSKPQGASKLNDAVAKQPAGVLSSLAEVIGGSGEKAFIDKGSSALTSLLGGTTAPALASALGRYAGIGEGGSKSLLGLLGPAVLGVLAHEQRDRGLDASGLARLLTSQKDNVAAALPSGFSKYLSDAGILEGVTTATTRPASREYAPQTPARAAPAWPWLLGALALLAVGALAWNHWAGRHRHVAEAPSPKIETPAAETGQTAEAPYVGLLNKLRGIKVGDVDIGDLSTAAVNDLYTSLSGIKDADTAQSALPGLTKATSEFDQLNGLLSQLSPETRKTLVDTFASIRPNLAHLVDKVLAIPGVGAIIKPAVDAINAKLDALTAT
jgi:Bacterial protein of unknown function (DUF937)